MTTVGSQDTTGPMTRDELQDLACLGFSADLTMQSFCHTAAYPKPVDINTQHSLPDFIMNRGGVSLRPGDGIIHSWLNRMLLPDTVGTGGDSHTRFPIGISFPAGSGLVAFAAAVRCLPGQLLPLRLGLGAILLAATASAAAFAVATIREVAEAVGLHPFRVRGAKYWYSIT